MGRAALRLIDQSKNHSILPDREREAARARIAEINSCTLCLDWRSGEGQASGLDEDLYAHVSEWRAYPEYSDRERLAIEYAERYALDHRRIDDAFFARLRAAYTDEEIVDLTMCVATYLAFGRFLSVLGLEGDSTLSGPGPSCPV